MAIPEDLKAAIDQLTHAATTIEARALELDMDPDIYEVSDLLRSANKRVWVAINKVEGDRVPLWYDLHTLMKAMVDHVGIGSVLDLWVELNERGIVRINVNGLLGLARQLGIRPSDHLTSIVVPEEEGAKDG